MGISTRNILKHMELEPPLDGIFILGSREMRVTFYSQQVRALNLVYALFAENRVKQGDRIAIIGGGVAGITAAVGAARRGLDVTLLERKEDVLSLQANCAKRWIHPRIYDWPAEESLQEDTDDLGVLTWTAGRAEDVIRGIKEQWRSEALRLKIRSEMGVRDLRLPASRDSRKLTWNPRNCSGHFSVLIVAVGFGVEKGFDEIPSHSYWRDDQLDQDDLDGKREFLVSGVGDGGLTDLLRATLRDFRHDTFLRDLSLDPRSNANARNLAQYLSAIERESEGVSDPKDAAQIISTGYQALEANTTKFVDTWLLSKKRDRVVYLNGPTDAALTSGASILNRFLASRVLQLGLASYWYGVIPKEGITKVGTRWTVTLEDGDSKSFDHVIIRHGTDPALARVFPKPDLWAASEQLRHRNELDQTREPHEGWYRTGWYVLETTKETGTPHPASGLGGADAPTAAVAAETTEDLIEREALAEVAVLEKHTREVLSLAGHELTELSKSSTGVGDFIATTHQGPFASRLLVRCVATPALEGHVLQDNLDSFQRAVAAMRREGTIDHGLFVIETAVQTSSGRHPLIHVSTPQQILRGVFDFRPYLRRLIDDFDRSELARAFIRSKMAQMGVHLEIQAGAADAQFEVNRSEPGPVTDIQNYCDSWLQMTDGENLCLLGDYGTGKTSFCRWYAAHQARRCLQDPDTQRIPLLIPLSKYTKAVDITAALTDFLVNECGLPNTRLPVFRALLESGQFLILLDGFDEMARYVDRQVRFQTIGDLGFFSVGRSRVILTGRPGYFPSHEELVDVLRSEPPSDIYAAARSALQELVKYDIYLVEPFSKEDINCYVRAAVGNPGVAERLLERIWSTYNLADLAARPVLLEMMVKSLPRLMQLSPDGVINAARLYETYTGFWIDREERKGEFRKLIQRHHKQLFVRELAYQMCVQDKPSLPAQALGPQIRAFFHIEEDDRLDHFSHDIRTCSFLRRVDGRGYSFVHRSFQEYFVAEKLVAAATQEQPEVWHAREFSVEILRFVSELLSGRGLQAETDRLFVWATDTSNAVLHVNAVLAAVASAGEIPKSVQEVCRIPAGALRELVQLQLGMVTQAPALLSWLTRLATKRVNRLYVAGRDHDHRDDAIQNAVLSIFERLSKMRLLRIDNLRGLVYLAAKKAYLDQRRLALRAGVHRTENLDYLDDVVDPSALPDEQLAQKQLVGEVDEFSATLSAREREVFELYYTDEAGASEIADSVGMSTAAVYQTISRLRAKLRLYIPRMHNTNT